MEAVPQSLRVGSSMQHLPYGVRQVSLHSTIPAGQSNAACTSKPPSHVHFGPVSHTPVSAHMLPMSAQPATTLSPSLSSVPSETKVGAVRQKRVSFSTASEEAAVVIAGLGRNSLTNVDIVDAKLFSRFQVVRGQACSTSVSENGLQPARKIGAREGAQAVRLPPSTDVSTTAPSSNLSIHARLPPSDPKLSDASRSDGGKTHVAPSSPVVSTTIPPSSNHSINAQLLPSSAIEDSPALHVAKGGHGPDPLSLVRLRTGRSSSPNVDDMELQVSDASQADRGRSKPPEISSTITDQDSAKIANEKQVGPRYSVKDRVEKINKLLGDRDVLKTHVIQAFKRVAPVSCVELDLDLLCAFRDLLVEKLKLPAEAFGDLKIEILRFDFTGTGSLKLNEAYKLVKFHLYEYRKFLGGAPEAVDIPFKSVKAAGYTINKKLGAGNQGTAYLATDSSGSSYCIKCYRKNRMSCGGVEELREEFEALRLLHCDSIAGAFELFQDSQCFCIVGDAFYGGDLTTLKQRANEQHVDMNEIWWRDVFKQILEALTFMHKQAMIHCDIKEPNIMIKTSDFHAPKAVVIDLGVAQAMASQSEGKPHGTPGYVPPETWETMKWYPSGDVFSLGVVLVQLLIGKVKEKIFVEGCRSMEQIREATRTRDPPLHLISSDMPNLKEVAQRCLEKNINDRPRSEEALKHNFFRTSTLTVSDLDRRKSYPVEVHPRNEFASQGITDSYVRDMRDVANGKNSTKKDETAHVIPAETDASGAMQLSHRESHSRFETLDFDFFSCCTTRDRE